MPPAEAPMPTIKKGFVFLFETMTDFFCKDFPVARGRALPDLFPILLFMPDDQGSRDPKTSEYQAKRKMITDN
jgi:hypothetical protein